MRIENEREDGHEQFYEEVKLILRNARAKTYQAVNTLMVETYWVIGKRIVEVEQSGQKKAKYGEKVLKGLSRALGNEFGKGFSYANLRNFRQFYLTYPDPEKCYALRSKLSWTHHRLIMRVEDRQANWPCSIKIAVKNNVGGITSNAPIAAIPGQPMS